MFHRLVIEPTFAPDAAGYPGLIDSVYSSMVIRHYTGGRHIPRELFEYHCYQAWWYVVIQIKKATGRALTRNEKDALVVWHSQDFVVPYRIAQYLDCLGNFVAGGEEYIQVLQPYQLGPGDNDVIKDGFFVSTGETQVTDGTFWLSTELVGLASCSSGWGYVGSSMSKC